MRPLRPIALALALAASGCDFFELPDLDSAVGVAVTPNAGLVTSEAGTTASFRVVLQTAPDANVRIVLASDDTTEGVVSPRTLTFTPQNWNAPQSVTITGVDDDVVDGRRPYRIVLSPAESTGFYAGVDPPDVEVVNDDDESPGFVLTTETDGVAGAAAGTVTTTEAGGTATFTLRLSTQPESNVTVAIASSRPEEATVGPTSLTFTPANWNAPQTVTVTGVNDAISDGPQAYTITTAPAVSSDGRYAGLDPPDVAGTNVDDDSAGVTVAPTSGLTTTEAGGSATFTVRLNSQPASDVAIGLASSSPGEAQVAPASLTFTAASWNAPQTVTVTGVDDAVADGNQPFTIVTTPAASADPAYAGLDAADVAATNLDDDSAGIVVAPTAGLTTTEAGGAATFTVRLASRPAAAVSVGLASSRPGEGVVSPSTLVFTPGNFNVPQLVTVTGVDDAVADGNQTYQVVTAPATSGDAAYAGLDPPNVGVTNVDDDSAGFLVAPTSGLTTTEAGGTATFAVRLASQPSSSVAIGVQTSDPTEGVASTAGLTFTAGNWNVEQQVTVAGAPDTVADGDQPYTIVLGAAVSADGRYDGLDPPDVALTNVDVPPPGPPAP